MLEIIRFFQNFRVRGAKTTAILLDLSQHHFKLCRIHCSQNRFQETVEIEKQKTKSTNKQKQTYKNAIQHSRTLNSSTTFNNIQNKTLTHSSNFRKNQQLLWDHSLFLLARIFCCAWSLCLKVTSFTFTVFKWSCCPSWEKKKRQAKNQKSWKHKDQKERPHFDLHFITECQCHLLFQTFLDVFFFFSCGDLRACLLFDERSCESQDHEASSFVSSFLCSFFRSFASHILFIPPKGENENSGWPSGEKMTDSKPAFLAIIFASSSVFACLL